MKILYTILIALVLVGCATTNNQPVCSEEIDESAADLPPYDGLPFVSHHNAGVRIPAKTGAAIGGIVGIPVTIVLLPITLPLTAITESNLMPLVPWTYCYCAGGTILGGIAWPFFGWW